jgi:tyrosyl-tRNA synthetase
LHCTFDFIENMNEIQTLLDRGTVDVLIRKDLEAALASGKKLRVKFGIDPTKPDMHLGHSVPLRKLKQFQDAGHTVILLFGGFTATIGDPTGKNEARPP